MKAQQLHNLCQLCPLSISILTFYYCPSSTILLYHDSQNNKALRIYIVVYWDFKMTYPFFNILVWMFVCIVSLVDLRFLGHNHHCLIKLTVSFRLLVNSNVNDNSILISTYARAHFFTLFLLFLLFYSLNSFLSWQNVEK